LPVDGYEQYLARLRLNLLGSRQEPSPSDPNISYTVEHPVPDNWIPMIPVQTQEDALLRRGTVDIPGPTDTVIQLEPHSSILTPGTPFYLTEGIVTPIAVGVQKYLRRTGSADGTMYAWTAREHAGNHKAAHILSEDTLPRRRGFGCYSELDRHRHH